MLFVRGAPNGAVLAAQRRAFEERKQLILIVDDTHFEKLLWCRAYLGSVDVHLEQMKLNFELTY